MAPRASARRRGGTKRGAADGDGGGGGGAAGATAASATPAGGAAKSRKVASRGAAAATGPRPPPASSQGSHGGVPSPAATPLSSEAATLAAAPTDESRSPRLLSLPDQLLKEVGSRLTLLDQSCLAASCHRLRHLLWDGVALGALTALVEHFPPAPSLGVAGGVEPGNGIASRICVPTAPPPHAGGAGRMEVVVAGVRLPRAQAADQGRAALRAVALAAEVASPRLRLPGVAAHILECHPVGVPFTCKIVKRADASETNARALWGIPKSWQWQQVRSSRECRTDYGWHLIFPLRDMMREAFLCRTPTGSGDKPLSSGGGDSIGFVRILSDMEARQEAKTRREGTRDLAAAAAVVVVECLVAERVAAGGGGDGGGRSRRKSGEKGGKGGGAAAAASSSAAPPAAGRPKFSRWVYDGLAPARCALSLFLSGSARGRQPAAQALLDNLAAVYDSLGADLHAFYDGCNRREWNAAALALGLAAQEAEGRATGKLGSVDTLVTTLSKPRKRKTWTGKCKCCH